MFTLLDICTIVHSRYKLNRKKTVNLRIALKIHTFVKKFLKYNNINSILVDEDILDVPQKCRIL